MFALYDGPPSIACTRLEPTTGSLRRLGSWNEYRPVVQDSKSNGHLERGGSRFSRLGRLKLHSLVRVSYTSVGRSFYPLIRVVSAYYATWADKMISALLLVLKTGTFPVAPWCHGCLFECYLQGLDAFFRLDVPVASLLVYCQLSIAIEQLSTCSSKC